MLLLLFSYSIPRTARLNSSTRNGLATYGRRWRSRNSCVRGATTSPVTNSTRRCRGFRRLPRDWKNFCPSIPGIFRSQITRSYSSCSARSSADSPSRSTSTRMPSSRSTSAISPPTVGSSSSTSTRGERLSRGMPFSPGPAAGGSRRLHQKTRAALWRAENMDRSTVLPHKPQHDCQPEAGAHARRLGRKKWIEDARLNRARNARPVVPHFETRPPGAGAGGANADQTALSALQDGLLGVLQQVQKHLLQLPEIPVYIRYRNSFFNHQADRGAGKRCPHQAGRAIHQFVQGNRRTDAASLPRKLQQLAENSRGALGLRQDAAHFGIYGSRARSALLQALCVAQNRRQRIAQLVHDAAGTLTEGNEFFGQRASGIV